MRIGAVTTACSLALCQLAATGCLCAGQNPLAQLADAMKQKAAEQAISVLLNNQLPLNLNAKNVYPTVSVLPGGPFQPKPIQLSRQDVDKPLPPGDYSVPTLAFCSEYSVHRPGAGVAYVLGPMQGKASGALAALYWRGTVEKNLPPQQLEGVGWAIQSGLTYAQMPKSYQAVIDNVIPDLKIQLNGDFIQSLETTYQSYAKTSHLPSLDQLLAKVGKPGELALSAERQRTALLRQNTNDQVKDQTLFQGQESGVYTPVKAENGAWTERIKGVAYMKLNIVGGNLAGNNVLQIRILPTIGSLAASQHGPRLVRTDYEAGPTADATPQGPTLSELIQGLIGYSVGQGAQALAQVAVLPKPVAPAQVKAGQVAGLRGTATVLRNGVLTQLGPGGTIYTNDTLQTSANSQAQIVFADQTQLNLAENTKLTIDNYVYDPSAPQNSNASYRWLSGAFEYVSGLIAKEKGSERIDTPVGCICIRGTKFIAHYTSAVAFEVDLIAGSAAVGSNVSAATPDSPAPVKISYSAVVTTKSTLTQAQYSVLKTQIFSP